jgi:uroporphyrinogen III methyltransferase/synthase
LTARALELIASAETILYDRLIPAEALDGARVDAELLFVGKQGGGDSVAQEHTQALLIERARAGRMVVRLKGGDPFVFGRGGEEALALREAGIAYEVVPGVTAGVAAAAYAGIPVTHRGLSTAVALITGHTQDDSPLGWSALAAFPGTLVFYMGVSQLGQIANALVDAGRSAEEPVALVERGTFADQRTVTATLKTVAAVAAREQVKAPAITIVGAVAELADQLAWLSRGPLSGRTVAVTRATTQASSLAAKLRELGAQVVQTPTIRTRKLPGPPLDPAPYDLICLTSAGGVELFFERLADGGRDARSLAHARVAAIGSATARALLAHGIVADVVPARALAESLVEALRDVPVTRALIARASEGREVLPRALRERGARVDELALYETLAEPLSQRTLASAATADYVTFTSASTVRNFLAASANGDPNAGAGAGTSAGAGPSREIFSAHTRLVSIGPATSTALREHGLEPHVEAERHDVDGLVEALVQDATPARSGG